MKLASTFGKLSKVKNFINIHPTVFCNQHSSKCSTIYSRRYFSQQSNGGKEPNGENTTPSSSSKSNTTPENPSNTPPTSSTPDANSEGYAQKVQKTIDSTTHFAVQKYEELERTLMNKIHESNRRRFRVYFFGSIAFIITTTFVFGDRIRTALSEKTADIAKETLENESLQIRTQELAMAVVQTVLNDKEITAHAATFLKEASTAPETQQALLELTMHVLQHPKTLTELYSLFKQLLQQLSEDKEVQGQLITLFSDVMQDAKLQQVLNRLVVELCKEPEVVKGVSELLVAVSATKEVTQATMNLLQTSTTEVIGNEEILTQSRQFVANVMGDDVLQKEGGNALWNTVYHALKPGVIRMTGVVIVCASIGALKLFLSPF